MKYSGSFLIFFVLSISSQAQDHVADSLKRSLLTAEDTLRVNILNKLAYRVMFSDPQQAEKYTLESIDYATAIGFIKGLAHARQVLGISYDVRGQYLKAIEAYESGIELLEHSNVRHATLTLVLNMSLGVAYYHQGNYDKALEILLKTLAQAEMLHRNEMIPTILMNIGLVYHDQKAYDKALEYYAMTRTRAAANQDSVLLGKAINNIGTLHLENKNQEEAIRSFDTSLVIKRHTNDQLGVGATLANLGRAYSELGNYPRALEYLDQSEVIRKRLDDKLGLVVTNDIRISILIIQKKFDEAEKLLQKNLELAKELGGENLVLVSGRYAEFFRAKGDFEKALYWYEIKTKHNDSLFNETKSRKLSELQVIYEVNKKEKEILLLEKEREEARFIRNALIVSLITLTIIIMLVIYFIRFRIKKQRQLYEMEHALNAKMIENAALREEELIKEIEFKNKELASYTINFVQKSELMEDLKRNLQDIVPENPEVAKKIAGISKLVESSYHVDREWEDFKMQFENVHQNFFRILKQRCPELTNGDLKLCALLKLNMNMKEAAKVLGISPESVKAARYRLRKKFGLAQDDNLVDFVINIDRENHVWSPGLN